MALVPSFEQQGAVNWDSILKQSVTFSISLLGRLSSYGVDPYSLIIAQHVARDFILSSDGQRNVLKSLEGLPMYRGYGNALWFGFGIDSFARILGKTDQGCSLLALCATLCETFGEDYAADTMHALVKLKNAPSNLSPSIAQWLMIVKGCAGVLSTSKFSLLVDGFLRLILRHPLRDSPQVLGPPRPQELAKVLDGLSRLTAGGLQAVTVDGYAPLAWIGAVAEWLFDLRVSLEDSEGNLLHASHGEVQESQCRLRAAPSTTEEVLNVSSTTHRLRSYNDVLNENTDFFPATNSRMEWHSCLGTAYGDDFTKLMELPELVGQTLGSATRLLDLHFRGATKVGFKVGFRTAPEHRYLWSSPAGSEFIDFITQRFPELEPIKESMLLWHRSSPQEADSSLAEALNLWISQCEMACPCRGYQSTARCCDSILATIFRIGLALFQTDHPDDLFPTRNGWRILTEERTAVHRNCGFLSRVFRHEEDEAYKIALILFSGVRLSTQRLEDVASCANGLCAYRQVLSDVRLDHEHIYRSRILPGQIMFNGRPYPRIVDATVRDADLPRPSDHDVLDKDFSDMTELSLWLSESSRGLGVYFTLRNPSLVAKRESRPFALCPARLVFLARLKAARLWCQGIESACRNSLLGQTELLFHEEPWIKLRLRKFNINVIIGGPAHEYYRAAVLFASDGAAVFVNAGQCIYCCLESIDKYSPPQDAALSATVSVVVQGQTESAWFWRPWNHEQESRHDAAGVQEPESKGAEVTKMRPNIRP
ncbi:hypothetical protein LIA77_00917 [Sarocladium implicatum]|nr:hypothetical protein LIA77_00917 [Sarocladium implicatum]